MLTLADGAFTSGSESALLYKLAREINILDCSSIFHLEDYKLKLLNVLFQPFGIIIILWRIAFPYMYEKIKEKHEHTIMRLGMLR